MIILKNLRIATMGFSKEMKGLREKQIARLIEKFLLKKSIICEVETK